MYGFVMLLAFGIGLFASTSALAQPPANGDNDINRDKIFSLPDRFDPEPPGGMKAFKQWVAANYKVPKAARKAGVNGRVLMSFTVEPDGRLSEIRTVKDIGYGTGKAAERLFRKSPRWTPGTQKGKPIRVGYTFPVTVGKLTQRNTKPSIIKATVHKH